MNNPEKHSESWSLKDVHRYLDGELSASERHELEKLALDDPFLADALEGLQTQAGPARDTDLAELRSLLDARVSNTNRKRLFPIMRAAAVLILLAGLAFTAFYTVYYKNKTLTAPGTAATQPQPTVSSPPPPAVSTPTPPSAPPAIAQNMPARAKKHTASNRRQATDTAIVPTGLAATSVAPIQSDADSVPLRPQPSFLPPVNPGLAIEKDKLALPRVIIRGTGNLVAFSGKVLDFNNRPVAGAHLGFKNNGYRTTTDDNGRFSLYLPQKDTTRQITVAMEGYEKAEYALNTNDAKGNVIYLKPNENAAKLDEVVVSGYGSKRREVIAAPPSDEPEILDSFWLRTSPVIGHNAYLAYLDKAKKTLPVDTAIHGIENISFLVDRKGALTEFKIETSLSPAHDAGVIRLITEGPAWKMLRGRNARALVTVAFP